MNHLNQSEIMLAQFDRIMRLLRRRPQGGRHVGRGGYRLLRTIAQSDGISTRQLADALDLRPSSLNERLVRLEQEELVTRERDPADQRVFLLRILPEGEAVLEAMQKERARAHETLAVLLTEEETATLIALTQKLADGLEEAGAQTKEPPCR